MSASPKTCGEVEGFVTMLIAACEDMGMNESLEVLLSAPDDRRKSAIYRFLELFREDGAPKALQDAFVCLLDDEVAERAYEVLHRCKRKGSGQL